LDLLEIIQQASLKASTYRNPPLEPFPGQPPPSAAAAEATNDQLAAAIRSSAGFQPITKAGCLLYSPLSYRPKMASTWQASVAVGTEPTGWCLVVLSPFGLLRELIAATSAYCK